MMSFITCSLCLDLIILDEVEMNEMCRNCSTILEKMRAYRLLGGRPERKRPLGGPRHRWAGNIEIWILER
jgi:hypothetical protein